MLQVNKFEVKVSRYRFRRGFPIPQNSRGYLQMAGCLARNDKLGRPDRCMCGSTNTFTLSLG